jgi:hypothetical protein
METKNCPYCGEEILAAAKKCKHCGEWLEKKSDIETPPKNTKKTKQEVVSDQGYKYAKLMAYVCYAAMYSAVISCLHDFGLEKGTGRGAFLAIPEHLNLFVSSILWCILLWNLNNYYSKRQNFPSGLLIALIFLEAMGGLFALLISGEEINENAFIVGLILLVSYFVIMLILGIKLSKLDFADSIGAWFINYSIGGFILFMLGIVFMDGDNYPWWTTVAVCLLDLVLLYMIKIEFEVELEEKNE